MTVWKTLACATLAAACHGGEETSRFPAREPGCEVQVFREHAPTIPIESVGTVNATCDDSVSTEACLRTLKDQACRLGADVLWEVSDPPAHDLGKIKLAGRAAHTK